MNDKPITITIDDPQRFIDEFEYAAKRISVIKDALDIYLEALRLVRADVSNLNELYRNIEYLTNNFVPNWLYALKYKIEDSLKDLNHGQS